jgi:undecaprenyl-phosphate galactose phosphotransferase
MRAIWFNDASSLTQSEASPKAAHVNGTAEDADVTDWIESIDASSDESADKPEIVSTHVVPADYRDAVSAARRPWRGKRAFDIVTALCIGLLSAPIILLVCAWLFVTPGRVLFGHTRVGRNGKLFKCYKFRTMVPNAERILEELLEAEPTLRAQWESDHKLVEDPRITRMGQFLRKTSLDELPQLWNVLRGDMSVVGPRPIVQEEMLHYGNTIRYYLAVRPGITGLWQVSGRNDTAYKDRVILDRAYVLSACFGLDIGILIGTISLVLRRSGAY